MDSQKRSTGERVVIGSLILVSVAILMGIQSLFLAHVEKALPGDSFWRFVTIACLLAPPVAVGLLAVLKLNYSRSSAQDYILTIGMGLELLLFCVNMIVAINSDSIQGTMLGTVGILMGGIAGVVSVGTVAFTLAADPVRGIQKSKIEHELNLAQMMQKETEQIILDALKSQGARARAQQGAELYVLDSFGDLLGRKLYANDSNPPPLKTIQGSEAHSDFLAQAPGERAIRSNGHSK